MDIIQAIVLGIVQGLTEFLPISSSGHLLLVPAILHWKDAGDGFTAVIQLGTVAATWIYFWDDLKKAIGAWFRSLSDPEVRKTTEGRIGWGVFWGTIPIVVLGIPLKKLATHFGVDRNIALCAALLIGFGILLWFADSRVKKTKGFDDFRVMDGVWMGLWQACALFPGASRSGSTITGGEFLKYERATAARVSFLLSVPAVTAAGLYELYGARKQLMEVGLVNTAVATVVSFFVGWWAIAFLIRYLQTKPMTVFVVYRVIVGAVVLGLFASGYFKPATDSQTRLGKGAPHWVSSAKSSQASSHSG